MKLRNSTLECVAAKSFFWMISQRTLKPRTNWVGKPSVTDRPRRALGRFARCFYPRGGYVERCCNRSRKQLRRGEQRQREPVVVPREQALGQIIERLPRRAEALAKRVEHSRQIVLGRQP